MSTYNHTAQGGLTVSGTAESFIVDTPVEVWLSRVLEETTGVPVWEGACDQDEGQNPLCIYNLISTEFGETMSGSSGHCIETYQIDFYSDTSKEAKELATKVRKVLQGFSDPEKQPFIDFIYLDDERSTREQDIPNGPWSFRRSQDYRIKSPLPN